METAAFIPESYMLNTKGYEFSLKGIEQVEGKDAYAIAVKTPAKREYTNYYDVANGLLVKRVSVQETPQGSMTISTIISGYKPFGGIQFPTKIVNDLGMMKLEINFSDVKINSGLKAEDVK